MIRQVGIGVILFIASTASGAESTKTENSLYPSVWYRPATGLLYFGPQNDKRFVLPNGLPDVLVVDNRAGKMQAFFSGKIYLIKKQRQKHQPEESVMLENGEQLMLRPIRNSIHPSQPIKQAGYDLAIAGEGIIRLEGTAMAQEYDAELQAQQWADPHGYADRPDKFLPCDPTGNGLSRIDAAGNAIWRKTIATIGRQVVAADFDESQRHCYLKDSRQRLIGQLISVHAAFADNTFLAVFYPFGIARLRLEDGQVPGFHKDLGFADTPTLLRQKLVLIDWERHFLVLYVKPDSALQQARDRFIYLTLQSFLFPNTLNR